MAHVTFPGNDETLHNIYSQNIRFIDFVNLFPDKDWDWFQLSENPNITWEDI